MVEGRRVNAHGTVRVMDAINEAGHPELEREVDDPEQTLRYITWRAEQEVGNQSLILQPVSGNGAGRKGKGKAGARHGGKGRPANVSALKLIARQGAGGKAQLGGWKGIVMGGLADGIAQIQKLHEEAMEAQRGEMERQREHFQVIVESLEERIQELEREKEGPGQDTMETEKAPPNLRTPELEEEASQSPRDETPMPSAIDKKAENPKIS